MADEQRTCVKAKLFRKISKNLSDYNVLLCSTTDYSHLPPAVKKNGAKTYITITGTNLPVIDSVEIQFFGDWVMNKKYGIQFKADSYQFVTPTSERGIKAFLKSKAFPGIGEKTADAIVSEFGKDSLRIIKDCPNKLLAIPGLSPSKLGLIISAFKKNEAFSDITVFLSGMGISSDSIVKINDKYGENAVDVIKKNPYAIQSIKGLGFKSCDKIARNLNTALDSYERVRGGIIETITSHIQQTGDTCISIKTLEDETMRLLNEGLDSPVSQQLFRTVAKTMACNKEIVFRNKEYVFSKAYDEAEEYASEKIKSLLESVSKVSGIDVLCSVEKYRKESSLILTENQAEAVKMALQNRVSVITGGPGTGKSTIVSAIIGCYEMLYKNSISLLAPTGKAARRLSEATGRPASTIHSKIGIFDSSFGKAPQMIPSGLVVVDEASMVDMQLLYKLLLSLSDDSILVFIGDVDQLPSVAAGNVLSDLISSNTIPVARLTEIFRQKKGGSIVSNAQKINMGITDIGYDEDFSLTEVSTEEEALTAIKRAYREEVNRFGIDNVALLSPLRRSQNGRFLICADELNVELQKEINPRKTDSYCILNNTEYRVHDRVLQWKNTEGSSNGDIGEILSIGEVNGDIALKIHWDNGHETIENRQTMADISLAYAISIHKSQGAEYKSVIIPMLSDQMCQLFRKELLYTATTRSKECIRWIGDTKAINATILKANADRRRVTLFSERLIAKIM